MGQDGVPIGRHRYMPAQRPFDGGRTVIAGGGDGAILIVEDEWLIADMIYTALRDAGYRTLGPVASVAQAMALLDVERPGFALLDVNLGTDRSFAIADRLAAAGIGFLFLSGRAQADVPVRHGIGNVLRKPVTSEGLTQALMRSYGDPAAASARPVE